MQSNTRRIVRNTIALYFRQILSMLVSLFTVRIVLNALGVEDYGIYNVVAGMVTMLSFLTNSMANAAQRNLSIELGCGNYEQLKNVFCLLVLIYISLSVFILIIAETIGLWFLKNILIIPYGRMIAVHWVYQFSVLSFLLSVMNTPYVAVVLAYEDMNIYAYISIVESVLRLIIAFLMSFIQIDKLQLYGILTCVVTFINILFYRIVCKIKYKECKYKFFFDKGLFGEIIGYTGWGLIGSVAGVCKNQVINILLNQFFNPFVVSARSIAGSVNTAVSSFSNNFANAIRPQIIKNYASEKNNIMTSLVFKGTKGTFFYYIYLFYHLYWKCR
jgi:O-antigen/teichoic acid export membrane protein